MIVSRQLRKSIMRVIRRNGAKNPEDQYVIVRTLVNEGLSGPYDGEELELAQAVGNAVHGPFYHGGPSGLSEIRPAGETGKSRWKTDKINAYGLSSRFAFDRLRWSFFTTSIEEARVYASQSVNGVVYRVQPSGQILADMDYFRPVFILSKIPGTAFHMHRTIMGQADFVEALAANVTSYCAPSAKVLGVVQ